MNQVAVDHSDFATPLVTPAARAGWGRLAMLLFLASDAMTFGGLLTGTLVLRAHSSDWPNPASTLALTLGLVMTVLLLASSLTIQQALSAARRSQRRHFRFFLLLTIGAGIAFLVLQAYEWVHLLSEGMTLHGNPWGAPLFGATFYTLTGFHGLHVLAGVVYLLAILRYGLKRSELATCHESVEMAGLYWHFVDIVWLFVFTCVYML
ncbi:MAG: heme-copper oxidase subunit III [Deltaproteobacteria bacterium]|nr:heme-copper oxidase subunit III [Deltaproteobacteria bacterium]